MPETTRSNAVLISSRIAAFSHPFQREISRIIIVKKRTGSVSIYKYANDWFQRVSSAIEFFPLSAEAE